MCYKRKDREFMQSLAGKRDAMTRNEGWAAHSGRMVAHGRLEESTPCWQKKYTVSTCSNCGCENVRVKGDVQDCWFCGDMYLDMSLMGCALKREVKRAVSRKQV